MVRVHVQLCNVLDTTYVTTTVNFWQIAVYAFGIHNKAIKLCEYAISLFAYLYARNERTTAPQVQKDQRLKLKLTCARVFACTIRMLRARGFHHIHFAACPPAPTRSTTLSRGGHSTDATKHNYTKRARGAVEWYLSKLRTEPLARFSDDAGTADGRRSPASLSCTGMRNNGHIFAHKIGDK